METNLSQTIDSTNYNARYDQSIKELLADKQVLARILKFTLSECAELSYDEIMAAMSEPEISRVRVEPGQTNTFERVSLKATEDAVPGEGSLFYDIRFEIYLNDCQEKILINIEAQKTTNSSSLGYNIENRIIFYISRMVSAQKNVEFSNSDYDNIKAVRSIWICMDAKDTEDSINRICLNTENIYGKEVELKDLDKMQAVIIRLRKNDNAQKSKNTLIALLEELIRVEDVNKKKMVLKDEYGFVLNKDIERKVNKMCNVSELVFERGIERGIEQGIERFLIESVKKKIQKKKSLDIILDEIEESPEMIEPIYFAVMMNPDKSSVEILNIIKNESDK